MELERTKNAKRNIISGMIYKFFSILMPFVIRTVIIYVLGMEFLGLDSLFSSILQVLNLSELGLSSAVTYCMYKPIAEENNKELCSFYNFYRKAYKMIGVFILLVGIVLLPFLPKLISGSIPENINIYALYIIYLSNTVISYLLFAYKNVLLNAYQRVDISNNIATVTKVLLYGIQLIVLLIFRNYYLFIMVLPICTIISNIITSIMVNSLFPDLKPEGKIDDIEKTNVIHQVAGVFVNKICVASRNSFDSIIISAFIGLSATALYNNYYYILNALVSIMAVLTSAITAGVGNSVALYSEEKNYKDFTKFNFIYIWIGGWFSVCLLCLYQPFMQLWVGKNSMLPMTSVILFSLYFFSLIIGDIRATYQVATGLWWENRYRSIIEAALNLLLNILLCKFYGLNGVLIATLTTILIVNFGGSSFILFKYYFKSYKVKNYILKTIYYGIVTGVAAGISMVLCNFADLNFVNAFICRIIICTLVPNIIYLVFYSRLNEFHEAFIWIKTTLLQRK